MRKNRTQGSARGRSGNWPFYLDARKDMKSDTLKQDLKKCALVFSRRRGLPLDDSHSSAVIFSDIADNFHPDSFANITKHSD